MAEMKPIQRGKNFTIFLSGNGKQKLIKIEACRFSYPHFGEQQENTNDNGKVKKTWGGVAMLPKSTHFEAKNAFKALLDELQAAAKVIVPDEYRCLKDGDKKVDKEGQPDLSAKGHYLITFAEQGRHRPGVRTRDNQLLTDPSEIDDKFYGGCWGSVLLRPWYFNGIAKGESKKYPRRLLCGFNGVQFLRDDEAFGQGRVDDTAAWGDETGDGDGDGMDGGSPSSPARSDDDF